MFDCINSQSFNFSGASQNQRMLCVEFRFLVPSSSLIGMKAVIVTVVPLKRRSNSFYRNLLVAGVFATLSFSDEVLRSAMSAGGTSLVTPTPPA